MKKYIVFGVIALALIVAGTAYAGSDRVEAYTIDPATLPEGVTSWVIDGRVFVRDDVSGNVWEWCQGECDGKTCPVPVGTPVTPESTPTDTPDGTVTPVPSSTPTPAVTPTDPAKENCNRGVGNSGNDCDPGNSSGQGQGGGRPAGEDRDENDTGPGNSGNNGNQNDRGK